MTLFVILPLGGCGKGTEGPADAGTDASGVAGDRASGGGTGGSDARPNGGAGGAGSGGISGQAGSGGSAASAGAGSQGGAGGSGSAGNAGQTGNAGSASGGSGTGGSSGTTGAGGQAGGLELLPWPGGNAVVTVDAQNEFSTNLSGLSYQPAASGIPAIMWGIQNQPSTLYELVFNGTIWTSTTSNSWGAGKVIHYPDGTGSPDSEGVARAEAGSSAIYVSTERDNDKGSISRPGVLRFDTAATGAELTATNEWNLASDLPVVSPNLGLEAITWVPDSFLVANGFFDESVADLYDPNDYPDHGTGLFLVGLEANGFIYAYALDHVSGGFQRIATFASGRTAIMDLDFDRDVGQLWAYCDNTCDNKASVLGLGTDGRFQLRLLYDHPSTLPDSNNEGIAVAPESECENNRKSFYWADDDALNGHALRRDLIPCGRLF